MTGTTGDAVAAVEDEAGEETLRVQRVNGLDLDVDAVETPRLNIVSIIFCLFRFGFAEDP